MGLTKPSRSKDISFWRGTNWNLQHLHFSSEQFLCLPYLFSIVNFLFAKVFQIWINFQKNKCKKFKTGLNQLQNINLCLLYQIVGIWRFLLLFVFCMHEYCCMILTISPLSYKQFIVKYVVLQFKANITSKLALETINNV